MAGKSSRQQGGTEWVRPVSRDASRALNPQLIAYADGCQPALLDILSVPVQARLPEGHQTENALVDEACRWSRSGALAWADIDQWLDAPRHLWSLNSHSAGMLNNRVHESDAVRSSLQLIRVPGLHVRAMAAPLAEQPWRRVIVGEFAYLGVQYRLHVTDSAIEAQCRVHPAQRLYIAEPVLCISLGTSFRQHNYKLIASVLYERRFP